MSWISVKLKNEGLSVWKILVMFKPTFGHLYSVKLTSLKTSSKTINIILYAASVNCNPIQHQNKHTNYSNLLHKNPIWALALVVIQSECNFIWMEGKFELLEFKFTTTWDWKKVLGAPPWKTRPVLIRFHDSACDIKICHNCKNKIWIN